MKKIHIIIMSMLAAALTAAGVFSIALWHQNTELKKSQAHLSLLLEQAESECDALKVQIGQLQEAAETESKTTDSDRSFNRSVRGDRNKNKWQKDSD